MAKKKPAKVISGLSEHRKNFVKLLNEFGAYGYSAKQFNKLLHRLGEQFKQGDVWLLYQKYAVKGWTHTYTDARGIEHCKVHTYWTQKGRLDLYSLLKKHGYVPLIELGGAV